MALVTNGSSQLHKTYQSRGTAKNSRRWAERLPEKFKVVIPIKLEFSASVGFIHKEYVTTHGHAIGKYCLRVILFTLIQYKIVHFQCTSCM
jgi:hypothetical protein